MFPISLGLIVNEVFLEPFKQENYAADHKTKVKSNRLNIAQDGLHFVFPACVVGETINACKL